MNVESFVFLCFLISFFFYFMFVNLIPLKKKQKKTSYNQICQNEVIYLNRIS